MSIFFFWLFLSNRRKCWGEWSQEMTQAELELLSPVRGQWFLSDLSEHVHLPIQFMF